MHMTYGRVRAGDDRTLFVQVSDCNVLEDEIFEKLREDIRRIAFVDWSALCSAKPHHIPLFIYLRVAPCANAGSHDSSSRTITVAL
jgi:hypothetical protein